MSSLKEILEMTQGPDGKFVIRQTRQNDDGQQSAPSGGRQLQTAQAGSVVPTTPTAVDTSGGAESLAAAILSGGLGGGGLDFGQQMQIEQLRNAGQLAATGLSGNIQAQIARMQEAGATGRTQFTTEAEARAAANQFIQAKIAELSNLLSQQGFVAPQLGAAVDIGGARNLLIEALRTGTVFPTLAREQLLAQAAENPSDIVRFLAMSAGKEVLSPSEEELQGRLRFDLPKTVREGQTARERLATSLEGVPNLSFEDILDRFMALVQPAAPPVDIGAAIAAALGGMGLGGGGGGGGAPAAAPAPQPTGIPASEVSDEIRRMRARAGGAGAVGARGRPAARLSVKDTTPFTGPVNSSMGAMGRYAEVVVAERLKATNSRAGDNLFSSRIGTLSRVAQTANMTDLRGLIKLLKRIPGYQPPGPRRGVAAGDVRADLITRVIDKMTSLLTARLQPAPARPTGSAMLPWQAEGKRVFDPGYFLLGEGHKGEGLKAGTAEYAFLAPGSVVAPMQPGEKPTMDSARRAVAEMLGLGRRASPGERLPSMAKGGYVVRSGDNLWDIISALGGDPTKWPQVAQAIGLRDPRRLQVGTVIPWAALAGIGARIPTSVTPAAPVSAVPKTTKPAAKPAVKPGPEQELLKKTVTGIQGLLNILSPSLQTDRPLAGQLAGYKLSPSAAFLADLKRLGIAPPKLPSWAAGPATGVPWANISQLAPEVKNTLTSLLGSVSDPNIVKTVFDLHQRLRERAFSGSEQVSLVS